MVKARLIVKGNVQGVGYRTLVKLFARRLGIAGLTRNLDDGSVEVFVEGSKRDINQFLKSIEVEGRPENPLSLHVQSIDTYWEGDSGYAPAWKEYSGFELDYGVEGLSPSDRETLDSLEWSKLHFVGMSNVFREELGGVKTEIRGMRGDVKNVDSGIKDVHGGVEQVHSEIRGMRGDVKEVYSAVNNMRGDMNTSFQEMADRYDAISSELVRTREELTRAVNGLLKLVEKFIHDRHNTDSQ